MAGIGSFAIHCILHLYSGFLDAVVSLSLALTLNNYDIIKNWRKVLFITVILGAAGEIFFYFPEILRVVSLVIVYLLVLRFYFGFINEKIIFVLFTLFFVMIIGQMFFSDIITIAFNITITDYFASPKIRLLFPLPYDIPLAIITYIAYKRKWSIFKIHGQIKIPFRIALPQVIQVFLLAIASGECFFISWSEHAANMAVILFIIDITTLISLFFIWRILHLAELEAVVIAQEKLAGEMRDKIDAVRAQRHDFINYVQIISSLIKDGQMKELAGYVEAIKREL